jgi:hypothetical protein
MNRRTFLKRAGVAAVALAAFPAPARSFPVFWNSLPNPAVSLHPELLIDAFGFGSGLGEWLAKRLGQFPWDEVVRLRNLTIEFAEHGRHWLGPRALNELLTIATDREEEPIVRESAIGALARAIREARDRHGPGSDALFVADLRPETTLWLARLLLEAEDREAPGWIERHPPVVRVQPDPSGDRNKAQEWIAALIEDRGLSQF